MDQKAFNSHLAQKMGIDAKEAARLVAAFTSVVRDRAANLDSIAIPGFGNFVVGKMAEKIVNDPATGQSVLTPPQIKIEFIAGAMLKKQVLQ